jgi:hypothetical protein
MILPWIITRKTNDVKQKTVCALFLSKEKWKLLGKVKK